MITTLVGDCRDTLHTLPDQSVQCVVTSPPYFGLRAYLAAASADKHREIGAEQTPAAYVASLIDVFTEVWRVLRDDGVLFLNLGDSYFGSSMTGGTNSKEGSAKRAGKMFSRSSRAQREQEYGIVGTAGQDFLACDRALQSRGGGRTDGACSRKTGICLYHAAEQASASCSKIQAHMAELRAHLPIGDYSGQQLSTQSLDAMRDRWRTAIHGAEQLLASLLSMMPESLPQPLDRSPQSDSFSAFRQSLHSFLLDVPAFAHTLDVANKTPDCMSGIASLGVQLECHSRYITTASQLVLAWLNTPQVQPHYTTSKLKPKDLIGIPWRVAFAMQEYGWILRSDCIWAKDNPMPESVRDRPTRSHEYVFLLTKQPRYYYDADAIAEPAVSNHASGNGFARPQQISRGGRGSADQWQPTAWRNRRSVWRVNTQSTPHAHFATMPEKLAELCILAGSRAGDTVLDPFAGSGTTGRVAIRHGRAAVLCELNPDYVAIQSQRTNGVQMVFAVSEQVSE